MRLPNGNWIDFDPTDPLAGFTETRSEHPLPEPLRSYAQAVMRGEEPQIQPGSPEWTRAELWAAAEGWVEP